MGNIITNQNLNNHILTKGPHKGIYVLETILIIVYQTKYLFRHDQIKQEVSKAHIPPAVAIRGCNTSEK